MKCHIRMKIEAACRRDLRTAMKRFDKCRTSGEWPGFLKTYEREVEEAFRRRTTARKLLDAAPR